MRGRTALVSEGPWTLLKASDNDVQVAPAFQASLEAEADNADTVSVLKSCALEPHTLQAGPQQANQTSPAMLRLVSDEPVNDENVRPVDNVFQVGAEIKPQKAAGYSGSLGDGGTVKKMTHFWEVALQDQARATSCDGGSRRNSSYEPREPVRSAGPCKPVGANVRDAATLRHARLMQRLRGDMQRQGELQELVAEKLRGAGRDGRDAGDAGGDAGDAGDASASHTSSASTPDHDASLASLVASEAGFAAGAGAACEDEHLASLHVFEENSRCLWKAQRGTMRLLLSYVDGRDRQRLCTKGGLLETDAKSLAGAGVGFGHSGLRALRRASKLFTREPEPHEPADEPEADDSIA